MYAHYSLNDEPVRWREKGNCREDLSRYFHRYAKNLTSTVDFVCLGSDLATAEAPKIPYISDYYKLNKQLGILSALVTGAFGAIFDDGLPFSYDRMCSLYGNYSNDYRQYWPNAVRIYTSSPENAPKGLGTLLNVPPAWLEYIPTTSFLLLIPKLCTRFHTHKEMAWALTNNHPLLFPFENHFGEIESTAFMMLRKLLGNLGWPIYHLTGDDIEFWRFLYLLLVVSDKSEFKAAMEMPKINGFHTWAKKTDFSVPGYRELTTFLEKGISKYLHYGYISYISEMPRDKIKEAKDER